MTDDQIIEVVTARKAGEKLQYRLRGATDWQDVDNKNTWNFDKFEFRIKPELFECWVYLDENGGIWSVDQDKEPIGPLNGRAVRMIEVR